MINRCKFLTFSVYHIITVCNITGTDITQLNSKDTMKNFRLPASLNNISNVTVYLPSPFRISGNVKVANHNYRDLITIEYED